MDYLITAVIAYLIGAMPTAYLIVRLLTGHDIRRLGTGNVGVMNTVRQVGLPAGMIAFLAEGAKAVAAIGCSWVLVGDPLAECIAVLGAVIGVNWSVFMRFAGGRGTTIVAFSALILLWPVVVGMGLLWLSLYRLTHDNFLATRINILALPFLTAAVAWAMDDSWYYVTLAIAGALVTLLRHRRETDDHFIVATAHARVEQ